MSAPTVHRAFGLTLRAHFALPELPLIDEAGPVDFDLRMMSAGEVRSAFSGSVEPPIAADGLEGDGCRFRTERGRDGDYRITADERLELHLDPRTRLLVVAPHALDHPAWRRFLLDTGLGTAALAWGFEALHASAFERGDAVVAILAAQGGGKSTLLCEALRRGHRLFCDDVLCLSRSGDEILAHPGPPLMNVTPMLPDGGRAEDVGAVLANMGEELWVMVDHHAVEPRPLSAVVLLDRGDHPSIDVGRLPINPMPLLVNALKSRREAVRQASRFALFADLAAQVPLLSLRAPRDARARQVLDALERVLDADQR